MKVKFWGTRGSIPTPQPEAMKYGGETPCLEVWTSEDRLIVLDAGTGIRRLGMALVKERPDVTAGAIFLTHLHWDHIQGLPFFIPLYNRKYRFTVYGPIRIDQDLEHRLGKQMSELFFPVTLDQIQDNITFEGIVEDPIAVGSAVVTPRALNHPQGVFGYRIEDAGKVFVFATDVEQPPEEPVSEDLVILAHDADVLVLDAQYTPEEYGPRRGWGHSTWRDAARVARACNAKKLVLYHHEPNHTDEHIDEIVRQARAEFPDTIAASRDLVLTL